jgi:hypothetical protein
LNNCIGTIVATYALCLSDSTSPTSVQSALKAYEDSLSSTYFQVNINFIN